jgi:hypothetical protein
MKRLLKLSLASVVLSMMLAQPLYAKKPNARKGKYLFRKHCRSCHSEKGEAKALSPISKTQAEWTAVFKNGEFKHLKCNDVWSERKEKDLNDMYAYMHDHAYDSPSPLKCK